MCVRTPLRLEPRASPRHVCPTSFTKNGRELQSVELTAAVVRQDVAPSGAGTVQPQGRSHTMIHSHVLYRGGRGVRSPADGLPRWPDER